MKKNKRGSRGVRIDLDEEWKLGSDPMQWILYKKAKDKEDEILDEEIESKSTWKKGFIAVGFFTTLENALKAYIDAKLRNSAARSVKELYNNQRRIIQNLNTALKPFRIVIENEGELQDKKKVVD